MFRAAAKVVDFLLTMIAVAVLSSLAITAGASPYIFAYQIAP